MDAAEWTKVPEVMTWFLEGSLPKCIHNLHDDGGDSARGPRSPLTSASRTHLRLRSSDNILSLEPRCKHGERMHEREDVREMLTTGDFFPVT
ncbi:hypothetical protein Y1Q_0020339 [Alligator mississippiensis]|uniref:Uncharacterized protein n=1 Tax=Alligator mississippiensis TaxID=8496 RepID=A0A151N6B4_ALLMI|nr:hypothetical protein Y1Q_0020339 [Alligator mississippiensis]